MDGKKEDFQILSQRHLEQINQNLTNLKNNDMCIIKIYEIAPSCFEDLKDGISIQMT